MTTVGLRVDVDTMRGTREGVPRLLDTLAKYGVDASFFFSVGPDNMGRHLWRALDPRFAWKMIRSDAVGLYGWDIALAGTLWPGRSIARKCGHIIQATDSAGHEVGLHAWDHHGWQARVDRMSTEQLTRAMQRGVDTLGDLLGRPPSCSAAPGWKCNNRVIEAKEPFGFAYNSDCRGHSVFVPVVHGKPYTTQIPTTLPTYDESIGRNGTMLENYNSRLLDLIGDADDSLNVLTVHAEVEGIARADMFDSFLRSCKERAIRMVPLGALLSDRPNAYPQGEISCAPIPGRAGTLAWQQASH